MELQKLFPQGIAIGGAFCNREKERAYIKDCLHHNEHIVLLSPRRYGKTSLLAQVIHENNFPGVISNLMVATNEQFARNAVLSAASDLLTQILPKSKASYQKFLALFSTLEAKVTLTALGQRVELSSNKSPQEVIIETLTQLDQAAKRAKKKCLLVFDEFQQIGSLRDDFVIEAAIRHAVERSVNITYIFSGSDQHLLKQMFSSKNRPLYQLCDLMELHRIEEKDLEKFIQKAAKDRWSKQLQENVLALLIKITDSHIIYINYLCRKLWKLETVPNEQAVLDCWNDFILNKNPWLMEEITNFSNNQKTVVAALAIEPTNEPMGQVFCTKIGLGAPSVRRVIESLIKKDILIRDTKGFYRVLDPGIAAFFRNIDYLKF